MIQHGDRNTGEEKSFIYIWQSSKNYVVTLRDDKATTPIIQNFSSESVSCKQVIFLQIFEVPMMSFIFQQNYNLICSESRSIINDANCYENFTLWSF